MIHISERDAKWMFFIYSFFTSLLGWCFWEVVFWALSHISISVGVH